MKIRYYKICFYLITIVLTVLLAVAFFFLLGLIPNFIDSGTAGKASNLWFIIRGIISSVIASLIICFLSRRKVLYIYIYKFLRSKAKNKNNHYNILILLLIRIFALYNLDPNTDRNCICNSKITILTGKEYSGKSFLIEKNLDAHICGENANLQKVELYNFDYHDFEKFRKNYSSGLFKNKILILDNIDSLNKSSFSSLMGDLRSKMYEKLIVVTSYYDPINNPLLQNNDNDIEIIQVESREDGSLIDTYKNTALSKANLRKNPQKHNKKINNLNDRLTELSDDTAFYFVAQSLFRAKRTHVLRKEFHTNLFKVAHLKNQLKKYFMLDEKGKYINKHIALEILTSKIVNAQINEKYNKLIVFKKYIDKNNNINVWLCELFDCAVNKKDINDARNIFDKVLFECNLNEALQIAKRFNKLMEFSIYFKLYLAILFERCNFPYDAIYIYEGIINDKKITDEFIKDYARIGYLCCAHTRKNTEQILNSISGKNPFIEFSKRYWTLHINMHKGEFNYDGFKNLLKDLNDNLDKLKGVSDYDMYYLLRRIYFETIRAYLLSDIEEYDDLLRISSLSYKVVTRLKELNKNEFIAYFYKFNIGRVIQYRILSAYAFGDVIDNSLFSAVLRLYNSASEVQTAGEFRCKEDYINFAIKVFEKSAEIFNRIGGPMELYVTFNKYELSLYRYKEPNEQIIAFMTNYKTTCAEKRLYEYVHFAISYLLKAYLYWDVNNDDQNHELIIIQLFEEYKNALGTKVQEHFNVYADCRLEFFKILYKAVDMLKHQNSSDDIKKQIKNHVRLFETKYSSYKREQKVLNHMCDANFVINRTSLSDLILFYPIVNQ